MAKVNIDLDTSTGEISITLDGKTLEGEVSNINIYSYEYQDFKRGEVEGIEAYIQMKSEEVNDGIRKLVTFVTANSAYAAKNIKRPHEARGDILIFKDDVNDNISEAAAVLFTR